MPNTSADQLNEQFQASKKTLKSLDDKKRLLSKQVANAKKENLDTAALIAQVKLISDDIKHTKTALKQLRKKIDDISAQNEPTKTTQAPQFTAQHNDSKVNASATITQLTPAEETNWNQYVTTHPNASIYHTIETQSVIKNSFNHETLYLLARNEREKVIGVLPLCRLKSRLFGDSWVSVPFFNYGGVLADNLKVANALMAEAESIIHSLGSNHIEYRHCHPMEARHCRDDKVTMLLSLPETSEELWQRIGSKLRAQIKKAQSNQLTVTTGRCELIDHFYSVFANNMRDLGTPVYSKQLFINMLEQHPSASITIVYNNNKPVAAGFTLGWRNTLEIPWASTLREANSLNANMLLYWSILSFAVDKKYQVFDFGRSSKDASTYKFKKQWGAEPHQLYWHYWLPDGAELPQVNPNNPKYKLLIKTWKRLPIWLTKLIGPLIVKNIP